MVEMPNSRGHSLKIRGLNFKRRCAGRVLFTESGRCMERIARGVVVAVTTLGFKRL